MSSSVIVTLNLSDSDALPFKGFLIMAESEKTATGIGAFYLDFDTNSTKYGPCGPSEVSDFYESM